MEILTISFFSLVVFGLRDVQAAPTLSARVAVLEKDMRAGKLTDVTIEANMAALAERVDLVFAEISGLKANAQNLKTQLNTVTQELRYVQQERDSYSNSLRKVRGRLTKQIRALQLQLDQTAVNLRDARTTRCPRTSAVSALTDPNQSRTVPPTPVTTQDSVAHASTTAAREDLTPNKTVPPTPVSTQDSDAHASTTDVSENLTPSKTVPPTPVTTQDSDAHATPSPATVRDLYNASRDGDLERVNRILDEGHVDINTRRGRWSLTPLMAAAGNGHRDVVEFLVGRGADVSLVSRGGNSFLHFACRGGDVETVKLILSLDVVDINSRGDNSMTPVMAAARYGRRDVVEFLVGRGADVSLVDKDGNTFLHYASLDGQLETVKLILSLNVVDINARNNYGQTAAYWARRRGHQRVLDLLVSRGAH